MASFTQYINPRVCYFLNILNAGEGETNKTPALRRFALSMLRRSQTSTGRRHDWELAVCTCAWSTLPAAHASSSCDASEVDTKESPSVRVLVVRAIISDTLVAGIVCISSHNRCRLAQRLPAFGQTWRLSVSWRLPAAGPPRALVTEVDEE
jgi:hypothetical protein